MLFHGAVLNVFRPYQRLPHGYRMGTFTSPDSFPTEAFAASLDQLKRLMVITHLHHPPTDRPIPVSWGRSCPTFLWPFEKS